MNNKKLISKIFEAGKKAGMDDMEVYITRGETFRVMISRQEIDSYDVSTNSGLGLRGFYNGKIGYSYTEKIAEDSIDFIINGAIENALINDNVDDDVIFEGSDKYLEVDSFNPELEKVTEKEKIDFAKEMEQKALSMDSRMVATQYCLFGTGSATSILANTKGLYLEDKGNHAYAVLWVLAMENGVYSSGMEIVAGNDFNKFSTDEIAKAAGTVALDFLDAKPIDSGDYKTLIDGKVFADTLSAVSSIFSARSVQKNLSMLKGKLGEKIASECVTLVDDPLLKGGTNSASFDGEGVATQYKEIIKDGVLQTYLHNLKSAGRDNVASTGNASRSSYKSTIGISPTNFYFKPGEKSVEELMEGIEKGIMIIELEGFHSGFNPISGDFSLPAKGYLIENGKKTDTVSQITVSGNYYKVLENIESVASDLKFAMGSGIGSPSMVVESLAIAGK